MKPQIVHKMKIDIQVMNGIKMTKNCKAASQNYKQYKLIAV